MTSPTDPGRLGTTHPELFEPPFAQRLGARTLAELDLRYADDARRLGYVCVRAPQTRGGRTLPGLWVAGADLARLDELLTEVERHRAERLAERAEREARGRSEREARRAREVVEELVRRSGLDSAAVEGALTPELRAQVAASALAPAEALVRALRPTFRGAALHPVELAFEVDGAVLRPTAPRHLAAVLTGGEAALREVLEADVAAFGAAAGALADEWEPTRPAWYPRAQLQSWALGVVSADRHARHPLLFVPPVRDALEADPLLANGYAHGAEFRVRVDPDEALAALWAAPSLARGQPLAELRRVLGELAARPVLEAARTFVDAHPLADVDPAYEYTTEEWEDTLLRAFGQSVDFKWKPHKTCSRAEQRLAEALHVRGLELSARRARRELPERLKDFYPLARSLGRRLTFVTGPTNSGKTHRALALLKESPTGAYFGPLRLLALEVYERLNEEGLPTSLVTGELVETVEDARHMAATVEMLDVARPLDVAVIDEVQMLEDRDRGSAWLHAVLGCPARHVVLVGSPSALGVVEKLAAVTGEPLEVVALERLNPLQVLKRPSRLDDLEPGTALVVFSRAAALSLAQHLRQDHGRRVSVIYGALSPEVRREQARMFREGETEIVVATDAIGMGLNLPIRTLLFTTAIKWNGETEEPIGRALTWQIAGRAGRYGLHEAGFVGALDHETLDHVREMLADEPAAVEFPLSYGLTLPIAEAIGRQLETAELSHILSFFANRLTLEEWALPQSAPDEALLASFVAGAGLRLRTQLTLSRAPATARDEVNPWFESMVQALIDDDPSHVRLLEAPLPAHDLRALEDRVRDLTLYCWMHYRFGRLFPHVAEAQAQLAELNARIVRELARDAGKRCASCDRPMRWDSEHARCDRCFRERRHPGRRLRA